MIEFGLIWFVSILCGILVGNSKGQLSSGIIWTIVLGPLGLVVLLCLPDNVGAAKERERERLLQQQVDLQRAQIQELKRLQFMVNPAVPPPLPPDTLRIGRGGQDLGEFTVDKVKEMLLNGQLSTNDYYFDSEAKDWLPLEVCLKL